MMLGLLLKVLKSLAELIVSLVLSACLRRRVNGDFTGRDSKPIYQLHSDNV